MKPGTGPAPPKRRGRRLALSAAVLIVSLAVLWLTLSWPRSGRLYDEVLAQKRGWRGAPHRSDPVLGVAPRPNARGEHLLRAGPPIPMGFDAQGLRVPVGEAGERRARRQQELAGRPLVLFLGDSMTYGDCTLAEHTFAELVGDWMGMRVANAGVCGYGLAHMVLRARELVPLLEPDVLVVQHSSWLADRGIRPYAPTYWGRVPTPYAVSLDPLRFASPLYTTKVTEFDLGAYTHPASGQPPGRAQFWREIGLPLLAHDDWGEALVAARWALGRIEKPVEDHVAFDRAAYAELTELARAHGARILVLPLALALEPVLNPAVYLPEGVWAVPAQMHLVKSLPTLDRATYERLYNHWRGDPPVLVDNHPNELAHQRIAEELVVWLRRGGFTAPGQDK